MVLAGGWTLVVWGTRIPLLEAGATGSDWLRIAAGLAAGAMVLVGGLRTRSLGTRTVAWINIAFAFAMVFLWLPSLLSVWTTDNTMGFRLVHTALAGVSMGFGVVLAQRAQDDMKGVSSDERVDDERREQEGQIHSRDPEDDHRS